MGRAGGCGSFHVYRFNDAQTSAIVLQVNEKMLGYGNGVHEFDVDPDEAGVMLGIDQFAEPAWSYYCDDVAGDDEPIATWKGISGHVRVEISGKEAPGVNPVWNDAHTVSVVMTNLVLQKNGSDETTRIPEVRIENVNVGWMPG